MATYTLNVTNANGNDGDMVFRQYSSFNLSSGNTLNMSNDSRGCIIIVDGDATINGTIKVRGGYGGTPADTHGYGVGLNLDKQVVLIIQLLILVMVQLMVMEYYLIYLLL